MVVVVVAAAVQPPGPREPSAAGGGLRRRKRGRRPQTRGRQGRRARRRQGVNKGDERRRACGRIFPPRPPRSRADMESAGRPRCGLCIHMRAPEWRAAGVSARRHAVGGDEELGGGKTLDVGKHARASGVVVGGRVGRQRPNRLPIPSLPPPDHGEGEGEGEREGEGEKEGGEGEGGGTRSGTGPLLRVATEYDWGHSVPGGRQHPGHRSIA